jgi:hypothetical protein
MNQFVRDIVDVKAQARRAAMLIKDLEALNARDEQDAQTRRREGMIADQAAADEAFEPHHFRAPAAHAGERPVLYRRRLISIGQPLLPPGDELRRVRIDACEQDAVDVFFPRVMAAVRAAAYDPDLVPAGEIKAIQRMDSNGHRITEFRGRESFVKQLGLENRRVVQFARQDGTLRDL